jgi:Integrase zinc binding domain
MNMFNIHIEHIHSANYKIAVLLSRPNGTEKIQIDHGPILNGTQYSLSIAKRQTQEIKSTIKEIIKDIHENDMFAHPGIIGTLQLMKIYLGTTGNYNQIKEIINECQICK